MRNTNKESGKTKTAFFIILIAILLYTFGPGLVRRFTHTSDGYYSSPVSNMDIERLFDR